MSKRVLYCFLAAALSPTPALADALPTNPHFRYRFTVEQFMSHMPVDDTAFSVRYVSKLKDGKTRIFPQSSYLEYLTNSDPILGAYYWHTPFNWQLPTLSLKFSNSTDHIATLSSLELHVSASSVDYMPVPIIPAYINVGVGELKVVNEGWGPMLNTEASVKIASNDECLNGIVEYEMPKQPLNLGTIDHSQSIDVASLVPSQLRNDVIVCAVGYLRYSDNAGKLHNLPFMAPINLVPPGPGAPLPPSAAYRVHLEAGRFDYDVSVPISQTVEANAAEHILLTISSDRSANFEFSVKARTTDNAVIDMGSVSLKLFRPKSATDNLERPPISHFKDIDLSTSSVTLKAAFKRVAANPNDASDIIVVATESWRLRNDMEKQAIEGELETELSKAGFSKGRVCFLDDQNECEQSFSLGR